MASASFTLGSKKIADLQNKVDGTEETTGQQGEYMVYESLTDTSSDSEESDEDRQDEFMAYESLTDTSSDSEESDGEDSNSEIRGRMPESEFVKWFGRTARRQLEPILSQP